MTPGNAEGGTTRQVVLVLDGGAEVVLWRMDGLADADLSVVDTLARLQLAARRIGGSIRLHNPCDQLRGLLELVGLTEVFADERRGADGSAPRRSGEGEGGTAADALADRPGPGLTLEAGGEAERRKQLGIEEVVDRGDPPL